MEKPEIPISKGMLMLLLMFSVLVDVGQFLIDFIPIAGWIVSAVIDFFVGLIFGLWYKMLGVQYSKGVILSYITGFILDLIPYVDVVGWTVDVLLVYGVVVAKHKAAQIAQMEHLE